MIAALTDWREWFTPDHLAMLTRLVLLLGVGLPLLGLLASFTVKVLRHRLSAQAAMLTRKGIFYAGAVLILVSVLNELNFDLTAILGAAGIVGVAVGFASQTSLSNLISGVFLISEKPFAVDDVIQVGATTGVVLSIDLLSVKLRTFDNKFVRIPNETIIKTEVVNITRYPIRRLDLTLGVAYKEDIRRVLTLLREIIDANPYCLDEPEPVVAFTGFGESQLDLFIGVWFAKADFLAMRNALLADIKERFDREGIEIPFPQRSVHVEHSILPPALAGAPPGGAP